MSDSSWVTRLQPIKIPKKIMNFNVKLTPDQMNESKLLNIDVVINDKYESFMKTIFNGDLAKAQNILGRQNYSLIKLQLMDTALASIYDSITYDESYAPILGKFTKEQNLNFYFTMIGLSSKSPITDVIERRFYKIFGLNLPLYELNGKYSAVHMLGGFMSPAQDIIIVNTTGQTDTKQVYHEVLHSVIRELRSTLDNEMYGDTEADQREEIIVHFMTDKPDTITNLQSTLSNLSIVKNKDGFVDGVKTTSNSKFYKTMESVSDSYRNTSQLDSFVQKCRKLANVTTDKVDVNRINDIRNYATNNMKRLTTNLKAHNDLLDYINQAGAKSSLNRVFSRFKR